VDAVAEEDEDKAGKKGGALWGGAGLESLEEGGTGEEKDGVAPDHLGLGAVTEQAIVADPLDTAEVEEHESLGTQVGVEVP